MGQKLLITPEYLQQITTLHEQDARWGTSGDIWGPAVAEFSQSLQATSILDYGCGKGVLIQGLRQCLPFYQGIIGYDPAIPAYNAAPTPADVVACTDVLEHIEPELIENVLDHIAELAIKGAFFVIATHPAKAILPDGRNAHLIQKGYDFWNDLIKARFSKVQQGEARSGRPELVFKAWK